MHSIRNTLFSRRFPSSGRNEMLHKTHYFLWHNSVIPNTSTFHHTIALLMCCSRCCCVSNRCKAKRAMYLCLLVLKIAVTDVAIIDYTKQVRLRDLLPTITIRKIFHFFTESSLRQWTSLWYTDEHTLNSFHFGIIKCALVSVKLLCT